MRAEATEGRLSLKLKPEFSHRVTAGGRREREERERRERSRPVLWICQTGQWREGGERERHTHALFVLELNEQKLRFGVVAVGKCCDIFFKGEHKLLQRSTVEWRGLKNPSCQTR